MPHLTCSSLGVLSAFTTSTSAVLGMGPIVKFLRKLVADVPIIRVIRDVAMPLAYKLVWTLRIPVGGFTTCAAVVA